MAKPGKKKERRAEEMEEAAAAAATAAPLTVEVPVTAPYPSAEVASAQDIPSSASTADLSGEPPQTFDSAFMSAVQISLWDNVLGPKIAKIWKGCEDLLPDTHEAVARYALMEDLERAEALHHPESKFNVLADWDIIAASAIFTGFYRQHLSGFAFSIMWRKRFLSRFLEIHEIVEEKMRYLARYLQSALTAGVGEALSRFSVLLGPFLDDLEVWMGSKIENQMNLSSMMDDSLGDMEMDFLGRIVTSHLQNHCHTVVVGADVAEVNKVSGRWKC